jgi:predicted Zn-dependent peptidase
MHLSVMINSGKKNETPGQQGYNSLVANLALKGNQKYTEDDQNDRAFAVGSELSSQAGYDYTTFSANFLSKDAATVLDLMSAAIIGPVFNKDRVNQYISYLISYNTPAKMDISDLAATYATLNVHGIENPLGRSIYKKQLQQVTPEKIKAFHAFNYTPRNTRLILCGNFDSNELKNLIENYFGSWQSAYGEVNGVELESPSIRKKEISFVNRVAATQCALRWVKNAPSRNDKDLLAFLIANQIFNEVLFREIREKGGKTYSIGSVHRPSKFSNLVNINCSVRSEEMLNTINLFDKILADFSKGNFTKDEYDIQVTKYRTDLYLNEFPEEVVNFYNPVLYDFEKRKNVLAELDKLTMEDVKKVIKKYYTPDSYKLVLAGDETLLGGQLAQIKDLKRLGPADLELKE